MTDDVLSEHATDHASWAQRVRPECRIHEMSWLEKLGYLWKYFASPRLGAPEAILNYFAEQKRLQAQLRSLPEAAGLNPVRIAFAGDVMWIRSQWQSFLPKETLRYFREFDGIVANLETMISPRIPVNEFLPDVLRFNSHKGLVTSFRDERGKSLFAALGLANNHVLDFGDSGALDTLSVLEEEGIATSGASRTPGNSSWASFSRGGIRFGVFSGCYGVNDANALKRTRLSINVLPGLAPDLPGTSADLSLASNALQEMSENGVDVKIVLLHWGSEFEFYPTARAMRLARRLVSAGADFIVGSHPHVAQPMEELFLNGLERELPSQLQSETPALHLNGKALLQTADGIPRKACILYSLGNFVTTMYTFNCRSAPIADVSFFRDPSSGKVSWKTPRFNLFYNQLPGIGRSRSLIPMENLLLPRNRPISRRRVEKKIALLAEHLGLNFSNEGLKHP